MYGDVVLGVGMVVMRVALMVLMRDKTRLWEALQVIIIYIFLVYCVW